MSSQQTPQRLHSIARYSSTVTIGGCNLRAACSIKAIRLVAMPKPPAGRSPAGTLPPAILLFCIRGNILGVIGSTLLLALVPVHLAVGDAPIDLLDAGAIRAGEV